MVPQGFEFIASPYVHSWVQACVNSYRRKGLESHPKTSLDALQQHLDTLSPSPEVFESPQLHFPALSVLQEPKKTPNHPKTGAG